jgi:hypothetical protein
MSRLVLPQTVAVTFYLASMAAPDRALAQNFVPFAALAGSETSVLMSGPPATPAPRLLPANPSKQVIAAQPQTAPALPEGAQTLPYIAPVVSDTAAPAAATR